MKGIATTGAFNKESKAMGEEAFDETVLAAGPVKWWVKRAHEGIMTDRLWVLGAPDPEMAAIEGLLRDAGERRGFAGAYEVTP